MLTPRRTKYRTQFKPQQGGFSLAGSSIAYGEYALRAETSGNLSSKQIEAARRAISRYMKRGGKLWIRIFPDRPITKKPPETRMGGGKGDLYEYVMPVRVGRVLFEMSGIDEQTAREALRLASHKLRVKSSFMKKGEDL